MSGTLLSTPDFDVNVIGVFVGVGLALLLILVAIALLVAHIRRNRSVQPSQSAAQHNGVRDAGAAAPRNQYEALVLRPPQTDYDLVPPQTYDILSLKDDNDAKPSPNGTDYENFTFET
jgi:hypothetical protein